MKISARNVFPGKVTKITDGAVNSEVVIEIAPGVEVTSIITKSSREYLQLEVGKEANAIVKASNVMIGAE